MSITQLQQQIKDREEKVARIQQSKTGFEQQLSTLNAEEESLIVSARTGDAAAKTRLVQIRQDAKICEREIRDDASATAEITRELDQLRAALAREQKEDTRQKLLREVAKFAKRAEENRGRVRAAAAELRKIGDTCTAEAEELRKHLLDLNEDFALNALTLATISLRHGLAQAAETVHHASSNALGYDCMMYMGRFITALEHLTRDIEREAETVPEPA
jgi:chromosome segregation ATPase